MSDNTIDGRPDIHLAIYRLRRVTDKYRDVDRELCPAVMTSVDDAILLREAIDNLLAREPTETSDADADPYVDLRDAWRSWEG